MNLDIDLENLSELMVFDQPGLNIKINLSDDELLMPLESILSIISQLWIVRFRLRIPMMMIQYDDRVVNIGGADN